ncbi:MAG TPA: N-acetylglucosamine-6-phosphate deacetylase [Planctomycetota bacterium]|nr:N-acetylglucosamine-6-phosphate deacetylase [Planctomycetota bacterium]
MKPPSLDLVVLGDRIYRDGSFVRGWIASRGERIAGRGEGTPPEARSVLDARGHFVVPGLVDLHVHGAGGADASSDDPEEVGTMARTLARHGTTAFLATLYPAPIETLVRRLERLRARRPGPEEAALLGVHLEGPFVNRTRAGALDPKTLRPPNVRDASRLIEAGGELLRTVTLAPELPGAAEVLRAFVRAGVRVSLGHSDATSEQAGAAVTAGARGVTHVFNAMRPFHHREAGLAGRALLDPSLTCELIGDLAHVGPEGVDLLLHAKGIEGVCLVSDGLRGTGTRAKTFTAGGRRHAVRDGVAYAGRGLLSGGGLPLLGALQRLLAARRLTLEEGLRLAAGNPAREARAEGRVGELRVGARADFLWIDGAGTMKRAFLSGRELLAHPNG